MATILADALSVPAPRQGGLTAAWSRLPALLRGAAFGLVAAAIWGLLQVSGRLAATGGLTPFDLAALRFGTAGLILLPWLARRGLGSMGGVGWSRALALVALIGPPFFMTMMGGYLFAPLAHGATILPATFSVAGLVLGAVIFAEALTAARIAGAAVVVLGLGLVAGTGLLHASGLTPLGDAMFAAAALMWAGATVLVRRWRVSPMQTTATVAVLSATIFLPLYLAFGTPGHLVALPFGTLLFHVAVSGVLAGIVAVLAFTRSVELLGPGRAALYPALVPAFATLLGVPLLGEAPNAVQAGGLLLVTAGLLVGAGALSFPRRTALPAGSR